MQNIFRRIYNAPYLLLTMAVFFWSVNSIVGRFMRLEVPPIALSFWRWAGASMLIFYFAWPQLKEDWPIIRRYLPLLLLLALTGVAMFNTLLYSGLQTTVALNGFLIQSTMPILIMLFSFFLFRDKISHLQGVGVALSLTGVVIVIARGDLEVLRSLSLNRGDVLIFIAAIGYSVYSALLRQRPTLHPLSFIAFTFVTGTLMLLPLYVWETVTIKALNLNGPTLLTIAYVSIFPSIVSYFCYNRGIELIGANRAGLFIHLNPVFGTIMAVLFLGETLFWFHGVGIVMIFIGIVLTLRHSN
ncbi:MAG: DMT family transporter [Deltaproteobacteria bacterium]|nr:DMT family transporter [Candidatus Tharpella aukensis]